MMKRFPCKLEVVERNGINVLDFICETENDSIAKGPLLQMFLKYVDASARYGGNILPTDNSWFPKEQGKMYMTFSLRFPDKYNLMEFVKDINANRI